MLPRILVTGANGFVGLPLCNELILRGYRVRSAVRSCSQSEGLPGEVIEVGDINDKTDWSRALEGVEVVIHLAARVHIMNDDSHNPLDAFRVLNVVGTEHLARSADAGGVRRLVYASSVKVNGERSLEQSFTEEDIPHPSDSYAISKWEAEQVLRTVAEETGLEVVIVRPPLIYGPRVRGNFLRLLKLVESAIPLPLGLVDNRRSMLYLGNFVDALIACAMHPNAAGNIYMVSDGVDVSTCKLVLDLSRIMGRGGVWPFPLPLLRLVGKVAGRSAELERLWGSLVVDSSKIRRDLGWVPPYTMEQGLTDTINWFKVRM